MKEDQMYLIGVTYDQWFNQQRVQVIKALRCLLYIGLKDAKELADEYIYNSDEMGMRYRNITFRCTAAQTAWAMCALQTGDTNLYGYCKDPHNDERYEDQKIFTFDWIERASDSGVLNVAMYERKAL